MLTEGKKKPSGDDNALHCRMERKMEILQHDYKQVEDTLGETMPVLVLFQAVRGNGIEPDRLVTHAGAGQSRLWLGLSASSAHGGA